jgi:hypothetical protein
VTPVVVTALSVPTPEPMLQVTPALAESFATVAVKACMPPPLSDMVAGLTLTLMESGVVVVVEPPPPPPQPAKKTRVDNPLKTAARTERTDIIPFLDIGLSITS